MSTKRAQLLRLIENWSSLDQKKFMAMIMDTYSTIDLGTLKTAILEKEVRAFKEKLQANSTITGIKSALKTLYREHPELRQIIKHNI